MGRPAFLAEYGFSEARRYFLVWRGQLYDSKAIVGVAHRHEFPAEGALTAADFSGGEATVKRKLEELGFEVMALDASPGERVRNPPWERDELILALDLYVREGLVDDTDPQVIELSELLNRLPLHPLQPDPSRFRNPNGVHLKLANFAALDPAYPGTGMQHGGQRDREVWDEFKDDHGRLRALADAIRAEGAQQQAAPLGPEDGEDEAQEGRMLYRRHRVRERDQRLVKGSSSARSSRFSSRLAAWPARYAGSTSRSPMASTASDTSSATTPSHSRRPPAREQLDSTTSRLSARTAIACSIEAIPHQPCRCSVK